MLSSFLRSSPDSIVFLVRELALCRHFLIRPLVMFMYKQHIPVGETGVQSWIRAQPCSWKVRGRWKEGGERKRMNRNMIRGLMTHNIWMGGRGEEERGVTVRVVKRYHGKKRGSRGRIQCQIQICRFSWMEKKEITGQKQSRPPRRRCGCYTKRHTKKYKSSRVKKKKRESFKCGGSETVSGRKGRREARFWQLLHSSTQSLVIFCHSRVNRQERRQIDINSTPTSYTCNQ